MEIINSLKKFDLFNGIENKDLVLLAEKSIYKKLDLKQMLFTEGLDGKYFFILLNGSIRLFKTTPDGKESTIKIINQGEILAEAVLFGINKYPVSAVAAEPSEVIGIHRDSFREMIKHPEARDAFISAVFTKLRFLTDQIHFLASHDVEDRFFKFLATTFGKKYQYDISIPKKDIASAIGTIPETFSRLILRMTRMKVIAWEKNKLNIQDKFWDSYDID